MIKNKKAVSENEANQCLVEGGNGLYRNWYQIEMPIRSDVADQLMCYQGSFKNGSKNINLTGESLYYVFSRLCRMIDYKDVNTNKATRIVYTGYNDESIVEKLGIGLSKWHAIKEILYNSGLINIIKRPYTWEDSKGNTLVGTRNVYVVNRIPDYAKEGEFCTVKWNFRDYNADKKAKKLVNISVNGKPPKFKNIEDKSDREVQTNDSSNMGESEGETPKVETSKVETPKVETSKVGAILSNPLGLSNPIVLRSPINLSSNKSEEDMKTEADRLIEQNNIKIIDQIYENCGFNEMETYSEIPHGKDLIKPIMRAVEEMVKYETTTITVREGTNRKPVVVVRKDIIQKLMRLNIIAIEIAIADMVKYRKRTSMENPTEFCKTTIYNISDQWETKMQQNIDYRYEEDRNKRGGGKSYE